MRSKWRGRLSIIDMGGCRAARSFGKHVFAKQLDTFGRRRLSPRAGSCDGWAKEMVEKPDGDLVDLDDVGLRIGNLIKKPIAKCLMMPYLSLFKTFNGGAHLPMPGLHDYHSEQAHKRMWKAAIQWNAEGAGHV